MILISIMHARWILLITLFSLTLACSAQPSQRESDTSNSTPAHHSENGFINPYLPKDYKPNLTRFLRARLFGKDKWPSAPKQYRRFWQPAEKNKLHSPSEKPQVTLLGHSTALLQYQGINILTDPIFSQRASPLSFAGPKRYTPAAIKLEQLPKIDAVVISHNHYDHLDIRTVKALGNDPLWLVPLGLKQWFAKVGIDNVIELDWWDSHPIMGMSIQALPSQHWSRRTIFDTNKSLWASWALKWSDFTVWFGGDTGYNNVQFKEIGTALKQVDLALIPIGAYEPRWFMRNQHVNPEDAVNIFKDINAINAFGIHWNTFVLTAEPIDEPPQRLKQAMRAQQLDSERFQAIPIGTTWISK